jgi:hypothetical protein
LADCEQYNTHEGEETNETKVVRIINHLDGPLTLSPPQCANPAFKLELKTVQPGKEFALHVSYAGPVSNAPRRMTHDGRGHRVAHIKGRC